ncbi:LLM class flavin-dependent oxidoreductase [Paenibacillus lutrae]|uniref:MsnO8 family LLM class oxidoreductase n=1 Tax=Paenibacillus lutrae TaxID=2078573 RepID=A0A7X3K1L6_9BACL|nr:LLM class flavin-dependent oxidoreductase [Paenibacillus lutrae]MVP02439.1 MsnO8 family LLM class oxidoreductase [Paenibacillus lutrae]
MAIKLSILDQTPIYEGETAAEAFQRTVRLAQKAEELGYTRFWVSEHHDSGVVAGSSPEVLIAHLLAKTDRIRLGSGGVMLQHYSPYKVAENFNVLASLGPGRIDLGIGRAPGGLPRSTQALQQGGADTASLTDKITELRQYIHNRLEEDHPLFGLRANPVTDHPADLYVLGTSTASAEIAAELGLPYVFSLFINGDPDTAIQALQAYRSNFNDAFGTEPQAILGVSVIAAESDEEAQRLAGDHKLVKIHLESGRTITVSNLEHAQEFGSQSKEKFTIEVKEPQVTKGSIEKVKKELLELQRATGVDEFIVITAVEDFNRRLRSFELLKEAFNDASNGDEIEANVSAGNPSSGKGEADDGGGKHRIVEPVI